MAMLSGTRGRVIAAVVGGPVDQVTILMQGSFCLQPARMVQGVDDAGEQAFAMVSAAG
jgi:hypothetical protein